MNKVSLLFIVAWLLLPPQAHASSIACPEYYAPVCGYIEVQCVRAPCYPVYQTYSNQCFLGADGAVFAHEEECDAKLLGPWRGASESPEGGDEEEYVPLDTEPYVPPPGCVAWYDGCNACGKDANGLEMCTLRACTGPPRDGYCTAYEEDLPPESPGSGDEPVSSPPEDTDPLPGRDILPFLPDESLESKPMGVIEHVWYVISNWFASLFGIQNEIEDPMRTYKDQPYRFSFSYPKEYYISVWYNEPDVLNPESTTGFPAIGFESTGKGQINEGLSLDDAPGFFVQVEHLESHPRDVTAQCAEVGLPTTDPQACFDADSQIYQGDMTTQADLMAEKEALRAATPGENSTLHWPMDETNLSERLAAEVVAASGGNVFIAANRSVSVQDQGSTGITFFLYTFTKEGHRITIFLTPGELVSPRDTPNARVLNYSRTDVMQSAYWNLLKTIASSYATF